MTSWIVATSLRIRQLVNKPSVIIYYYLSPFICLLAFVLSAKEVGLTACVSCFVKCVFTVAVFPDLNNQLGEYFIIITDGNNGQTFESQIQAVTDCWMLMLIVLLNVKQWANGYEWVKQKKTINLDDRFFKAAKVIHHSESSVKNDPLLPFLQADVFLKASHISYVFLWHAYRKKVKLILASHKRQRIQTI